MKTLIVLCADERIVDGRPLFLNKHPDGKLIAEKVIEGIYAETYDRIIYTIMKSVDDKYDAKQIIMSVVGDRYPVEVVMLQEKTNGPADTVYETIIAANITGSFVVRDSLNSINITSQIEGNFLAGLDLTKTERDVFNVKSKSFIIFNEQRQVLDVIEKKFRSDVISVGLYGFKKVEDFLFAYERLNDDSYVIKKLYLSNIISYLIGYKKRIFKCVEVSNHEDWGNSEAWRALQNTYATCFIDIDKLCDGEMKGLDAIAERLQIMQGMKLSLVLYSSRRDIDKQEMMQKLVDKNIHCVDIVCGVSNSDIKFIVESEEQLKRISYGV